MLVPQEELTEEATASVSPKDQLTEQIATLAIEAATALYSQRCRYIKVYPRYKMHYPWRGKKVGMWRLKHLQNPLWLGVDGNIYRGEGVYAFVDRPEYCQLAEYHLRDSEGLQRIVDALQELLNEFAVSLPETPVSSDAEL